MINRMMMVILLTNSVVLSMENDAQLRNDLAIYTKNLKDMLGAVMSNDTSSMERLYGCCSCNINRPVFNYHDLKGKFWNKITPLILATFYNHQEMVTFLIEKKVRLHLKDEYGDTALHIAARTGQDDLVSLLLKAGASVDIKNDDGQTALQAAENSLLLKYVSSYRSKFENIFDMLSLNEEKIFDTFSFLL